MADIEKKLAQLRQAYEAGILDEETFRSLPEDLGTGTGGDDIDISAGSLIMTEFLLSSFFQGEKNHARVASRSLNYGMAGFF